MNELYGPEITSAFATMVEREEFYNGRRKPMETGGMYMQFARTMAYDAIIPGRWSITLMQSLSVLNAASRGSFVDAMKLVLGQIPSIISVVSNMVNNMGRYGFTEENIRASVSVLEGADLVAKHDHKQLYGYSNPLMEYSGLTAPGLLSKIRVGGNTLAQKLMMPNTLLDAVARITAWNAFYKAEYSRMLDDGQNDPAILEAEAARFARREIRSTQPSVSPFDKSLMQTDSELAKMFVPFSSGTQPVFQAYMLDGVIPFLQATKSGLKHGDWSAMGDIFTGNGEIKSTLLNRITFGVVLPALMYGFISRRRLPEEREAWSDVITYPFKLIPAGGYAISTVIANAIGGNENRMQPEINILPLQLFNAALSVGSTAAGMWKEKENISEETMFKFIRQTADVFSLSAGMPMTITELPGKVVNYSRNGIGEESGIAALMNLMGVPVRPELKEPE